MCRAIQRVARKWPLLLLCIKQFYLCFVFSGRYKKKDGTLFGMWRRDTEARVGYCFPPKKIKMFQSFFCLVSHRRHGNLPQIYNEAHKKEKEGKQNTRIIFLIGKRKSQSRRAWLNPSSMGANRGSINSAAVCRYVFSFLPFFLHPLGWEYRASDRGSRSYGPQCLHCASSAEQLVQIF